MHKRTEIRDAIKQMLLNNTDCNANVYSNRISAFWKTELPSISIFTTEEDAVPRDMKNQQYIRTMNVRLDIYVEGTEDLDQTLDSLCDQVETIMTVDQGLLGNALGSKLTSTQVELAGEGSTPIGVLSLNYEIKYIK